VLDLNRGVIHRGSSGSIHNSKAYEEFCPPPPRCDSDENEERLHMGERLPLRVRSDELVDVVGALSEFRAVRQVVWG
jgi:hypothetical protein